VLAEILTQTHHYFDAVVAAGDWEQFVEWCRYADFEIPADLPDPVTIYRGAAGATARQAAEGVFWSLDRERAEWFARRENASPQVVVSAKVPKDALVSGSRGKEWRLNTWRPT